MHQILVLPNIRASGYLANLKAGYRISDVAGYRYQTSGMAGYQISGGYQTIFFKYSKLFLERKKHLTLFINSYIVLCNKNLKTTANYRFKIYRSFLRRIIRLAISGIRTETGYQTRSDIPS